MGLIGEIGDGPVAVDTAIFIYFIEENPRYLPLIGPLFEEADLGTRKLVTSALTLLEVLVVPYRAGNAPLADRYERLLTNSRGIRMTDVTREQLQFAAQLRATMALRTADAIQVASALSAGCRTFLTNDRRIPAIPGLRVLQLSTPA